MSGFRTGLARWFANRSGFLNESMCGDGGLDESEGGVPDG
jgi:hypothetical protein